jgi:hypothetical protein
LSDGLASVPALVLSLEERVFGRLLSPAVRGAAAVQLLLLALAVYRAEDVSRLVSSCVPYVLACVVAAVSASSGWVAMESYLEWRGTRQRRVEAIAMAAKRLLRDAHMGGPYPVDFLYCELQDIAAEGVWSTVFPSMMPAHRDAGGFTLGSPIPAVRRTLGLLSPQAKAQAPLSQVHAAEPPQSAPQTAITRHMLKALWAAAQREVAEDHRLVITDMIVAGAPKRCWKLSGSSVSVQSLRQPVTVVSSAGKSNEPNRPPAASGGYAQTGTINRNASASASASASAPTSVGYTASADAFLPSSSSSSSSSSSTPFSPLDKKLLRAAIGSADRYSGGLSAVETDRRLRKESSAGKDTDSTAVWLAKLPLRLLGRALLFLLRALLAGIGRALHALWRWLCS